MSLLKSQLPCSNEMLRSGSLLVRAYPDVCYCNFLFVCSRYLNYPLEVVGLLQCYGIKPVMVFDGGKLKAKEMVSCCK